MFDHYAEVYQYQTGRKTKIHSEILADNKNTNGGIGL